MIRSLLFFLVILRVYGYPFFSPDGDIPDKEKLHDFEKYAKGPENLMRNLDYKNTKSAERDEEIRTTTVQPTEGNVPKVAIVKSRVQEEQEGAKIHEEEISTEEISSEILNPKDPANKEKNLEETGHGPVMPSMKRKTIEIPKLPPPSEDPLPADLPKVDSELDTANKTVADLTKLIAPAPKTKIDDIPEEVPEKTEPEISETSTDMFPINEMHLNSTLDVKEDQEIDVMPQIFMTEPPHTTNRPTLEATTPKPDRVLGAPKPDGDVLPTTSASPTSLPPTIPPVHIHAVEIDAKPSQTDQKNPPEVTLWEKIMIGLRCSMRDCRDALLPTEAYLRELTAPTVVRKFRRHEAMLCTCGVRENQEEKA